MTTMTATLRENLLRLAQAYLEAVPQSPVTLSKFMARDAGLLTRLATTDAQFTVGKYDETVQNFSDYWPEEVPWPAEVPRPQRTEEKVQPALARSRKRVRDAAGG